MDGINFKTYDPVAQLIATGGGASSSLPLTGGTLNGNLTMQVPFKISQSEAPTFDPDLTNKLYVDNSNNMAFVTYNQSVNQVLNNAGSKISFDLTNPQDNATTSSITITKTSNTDIQIQSTSTLNTGFRVTFYIDGVQSGDVAKSARAYFIILDASGPVTIGNAATSLFINTATGINPAYNFWTPGYITGYIKLDANSSVTIYVNGNTLDIADSVNTNFATNNNAQASIMIEQIY